MKKPISQELEHTRRQFEASFHEAQFYNRQTRDSDHLALLENLLAPNPGDVILDLGTGSGYVAFALAEKYPQCTITGLDIVAETLKRNRQKAGARENLSFCVYDGGRFPFPDESMDLVVSRYTFHHFPDPPRSLREVRRVLKPGGGLVLADPTPNENDRDGFVDAYMRMKPDGHVKFYPFTELDAMLRAVGLTCQRREYTAIRFPRKHPEDYRPLLEKYPQEVWQGYGVEVIGDEIWITEKVLNLVCKKEGTP